jgi:hypothetical protein
MQRTIRRAAGGMAMAGGMIALRPGTYANRIVCHAVADAGRRLRYTAGRLQGLGYHLAGRHPDPDVDDDLLADRIRSELGGLEKQRDLPHVHVMVERHIALLHGDVPTQADADAIEKAVAAVSGVKGVNSHLHVGLIRGETRPSQGHTNHPS